MIFSKLCIFLLFLIYMIFWVQIPGLLFTELLLPRRLNFAIRFLSGFFLGFIVLAIIYFIESLTGIPYMIAIAGPIFTIIAIAKWFKDGKPKFLNSGETIRQSFIIIIVIIFVISTLGLQAIYGRANEGITTKVYHDFLFHTGNIVSLSRSFPNIDIRVDGLTLYYHYFMELLFAMCKHIFGMNAFDLYMTGNALATTWTLAPACLCLAERIRAGRTIKERRYFFYCIGIFISCVGVQLFTNAYARQNASWTNNHLFVNANALGFAVASIIVIFEILVDAWNEKYSNKVCLALLLLSMASTGFKGPTGLLIVAITGSVLVIEALIKRKLSMGKVWYFLAITIGFVITYFEVVAGLTVTGSNNHETKLSTYGTLKCSAISSLLYDHFGVDYLHEPWKIICLLLCVCFIMGPSVVVVAGFMLKRFRELIKTGEIGDIYDWFVIGSILIANIGFCIITIEGMSQGYLIISIVPFAFYSCVRMFESNSNKFIRFVCRFTWALGAIVLVLEPCIYVKDTIKQNEIYARTDDEKTDEVSSDLMAGYLWIRDNTPDDSLIAVDIHTENLDYRQIYFYCGAFGERQCYLEGFDYSDVEEEVTGQMLDENQAFYSSDAATAEAALEDTGIDYLVVSSLMNPDYQPSTKRLTLEYSNEKVQIYSFK